MVAQAPVVSPISGAYARAFDRATAERLVAYKNSDGTYSVKDYTITVLDPHKLTAMTCTCIGYSRGRVCKHVALVAFCRKHHVHAARPAPTPVPVMTEDFAQWLNR